MISNYPVVQCMAQATALGGLSLNIASIAHAGQHDLYGQPYLRHLLRTAENVILLSDEDQVVLAVSVALLHDVLEDSEWSRRDLATLGRIPSEVLDRVSLLTRRGGYQEYITNIIDSGDWVSMAVKMVDLGDHLDESRDIPSHPNYSTVLSLRKRYRKAHDRLVSAMGALNEAKSCR